MALASITQLLNTPRNKQQLQQFVNLTHRFLTDSDKERYYDEMRQRVDKQLLNQFSFFDEMAPVELSTNWNILQWQRKNNVSIASVMNTGGNIPSTQMGQLIEIKGGYAKLGLSYNFDEQTELKFFELTETNNFPDHFIKNLFNDVNDLQKKVMKTSNVLFAQLVYQGFVNYVDSRTGVGIQIKYDTRPTLFPDPVDPQVSWDNYDTATGILDLINHCNAFYRINGFYPAQIRMARSLMQHLMLQKSTAVFAESHGLISSNSTSTLPKRVSRKIIKQIVEETEELPPIVEWDAQYAIEIAPNQTSRGRYIPDTHYALCCPNMGKRIWSPTIESAKMNKGKGKPGIFLMTEEQEQISPPKSRAFAVGRYFPFVKDERTLAGRRVITAA